MGIEHLPPVSITPKHIADWVNDPNWRAKANTRNVQLNSIRSFTGYCNDSGFTNGDPARLVEVVLDKLSHEQKETHERSPFTPEEINRLKLELDGRHGGAWPFWRFAVPLAAETGLRLGDICQLEWECFSVPGRLIVHMDKVKKRIDVPISEEVSQRLGEIPVLSAQYLFPEQCLINRDVKRRARLSMQFGRVCASLNPPIAGKSFHCLRHSVATSKFTRTDKAELAKRLAEVLTLEEIASLLGHSSTKTTKGYIH